MCECHKVCACVSGHSCIHIDMYIHVHAGVQGCRSHLIGSLDQPTNVRCQLVFVRFLPITVQQLPEKTMTSFNYPPITL